jgi:hypothetical protein
MEQALSCLGGPWVEMRERLSSQILAGRPIVLPPPSVHAAAASASPGLLAQGSHDDTASSPLVRTVNHQVHLFSVRFEIQP